MGDEQGKVEAAEKVKWRRVGPWLVARVVRSGKGSRDEVRFEIATVWCGTEFREMKGY